MALRVLPARPSRGDFGRQAMLVGGALAAAALALLVNGGPAAAADPLSGALDSIGNAVTSDEAAGQAVELLDPLVDAAREEVEPVLDPVGATIAPVTAPVAPIVEPVLDGLGPIGEVIEEAAAPILDPGGPPLVDVPLPEPPAPGVTPPLEDPDSTAPDWSRDGATPIGDGTDRDRVATPHVPWLLEHAAQAAAAPVADGVPAPSEAAPTHSIAGRSVAGPPERPTDAGPIAALRRLVTESTAALGSGGTGLVWVAALVAFAFGLARRTHLIHDTLALPTGRLLSTPAPSG